MSEVSSIYFDNNATTRPLPEVLEVVSRVSRDNFANPGSRHRSGRRARQVLEEARESIAALLGAAPDEVVFTSGGTESNNMALRGLVPGAPGAIALTAGEHPSVAETCYFLEEEGWRLQFLPLNGDGRLALPTEGSQPRTLLDADVRLATVILAHNETGVIQDLSPLAAECQARKIPLHVDAVQAVGKIPVNFHELGAASLSIGAHKFHGPRGIGALLVRRGWSLTPSTYGGHQEGDGRPGTEGVALIAGMARALELFHAAREQREAHLSELRDRLEQRLRELCSPVLLNGSRTHRLPNTLNLAFPGVDGEALLVALDLAGIECSQGSACASGSSEPPPVLVAMNLPPERLRSSIRFSLGIENTAEEIERGGAIIAATVRRLRDSGTPVTTEPAGWHITEELSSH